MFKRLVMVGLIPAIITFVGMACSGGEQNSNENSSATNENSTGGDDNLGDTDVNGVDRNENGETFEAQSEVLVVPRSVGGGIDEATNFSVERETQQSAEQQNRKRNGARYALQFLKAARQRFRRSLNVARRIENAPLAELPEGIQNSEFAVTTLSGEEVCVRISTEPFALEEGGQVQGGALLTSDLAEEGEAISLRVWINYECSDNEEDYLRFYGSILESKPEEVSLDDDDDSSEGAWRAGRGLAWVNPGALLDIDVGYWAKAGWDHTDQANRITVFQERGRLTTEIVLAGARYVVTRNELTDQEGNDLLCKRVHSTIKFEEHPLLTELDFRLGLCFLADEEGEQVDRLLASGWYTLKDNEEPVSFEVGCFRDQEDDTDSDCSERIDPELLDLDDSVLSDGPLEEDGAVLPDSSFSETPPVTVAGETVDLDG